MAERKIERVLKRTVKRFPRNLEKRAEAILSTINTEPKQILLAFCLDDSAKTCSQLRNLFTDFVEPQEHWVPIDKTFEGYSHQTFVPIGMVAEELIQYSGMGEPVLTWKITEAGKRYGRPSAAFALKYAVEHGISLYSILVSTSSPGESRSPYNAFRVLSILDKEGVLRETDLSIKIGLNHCNVGSHLQRLKKMGFIYYDSANIEEPGFAVYKWKHGKPENAKTVAYYKTLTQKIAELIYRKKQISTHEISNVVSNKNDVSRVVSGLVEQGLVKPVKFIGRDIQSEAYILEPGREFVEEFCEPLEYALEHDDFSHIENTTRFFADFDVARDYAGKGMDLYSKVSPHKSPRDMEQVQRSAIDFVRKYQNEHGIGPRAKEIMKRCRLHVRYLTPLVGHQLVKYREGRAVRYEINPDYSESLGVLSL